MAIAQSVDPRYTTVVTGEQSGCEHSIVTDSESRGVGGTAGMSPTTLLDGALAACVSMTIQIAADVRGTALDSVRVEVTHETVENQTQFTLHVDLTGDLTEQERAGLLRVLRGCPVSKILSNPIAIELAGA
ncbi:MAG: OsmC family protein [Candidatus Nanopelagicales bacterium]